MYVDVAAKPVLMYNIIPPPRLLFHGRAWLFFVCFAQFLSAHSPYYMHLAKGLNFTAKKNPKKKTCLGLGFDLMTTFTPSPPYQLSYADICRSRLKIKIKRHQPTEARECSAPSGVLFLVSLYIWSCMCFALLCWGLLDNHMKRHAIAREWHKERLWK